MSYIDAPVEEIIIQSQKIFERFPDAINRNFYSCPNGASYYSKSISKDPEIMCEYPGAWYNFGAIFYGKIPYI